MEYIFLIKQLMTKGINVPSTH